MIVLLKSKLPISVYVAVVGTDVVSFAWVG